MNTVFVMLAEGFEEIEAVTIVDVLRRGGLETVTVAIGDGLLVTGGHGLAVKADRLFAETDFSQGSMVILPGGGAGTKNLAAHAGVARVLREYAAAGKYIAAICAAPSVPGQMGLLAGKKATCYPGFEEQLKGADISDSPVVVESMFVTSRGPATAMSFALKLVELLAGEKMAREVADGMLYKA
jgi:4-methyl-5(b-hydroxyethyl)-thiazole monophosphate biosynthesis